MEINTLIAIAGIGLFTLICQWVAWIIKLPPILLLLLTGLMLGPVFGVLHPDKLFGDLLYPLVSLSVAIILFEGSLTLKMSELHDLRRVVRNLITVGLVFTATASAILVHYIFHTSWSFSALVGTITAVSGPTVITPMLRTIRPTQLISTTLRWEGIMIDPFGALLAVLVFGFTTSAHNNADLLRVLLDFGGMIFIGALLGIIAAYGLGVALRRHWIPDFLNNITTLILVMSVFALSNLINDGAGLLAVTVMGIWLTNMKKVPIEDILGFEESLSILLISGLFIILAARVQITLSSNLLWQSVLLFLALQFVVRPISAYICSIGSKLNWRERTFIAWVMPRGIVAAATAAIFSFRLAEKGMSSSNLMVVITLFVIIGTVVFQSITARFVAKLLNVAEPEKTGFLIVGANPLARAIGEALKQHGFPILLTGMSWEYIQAARMQSLPTYYGNPVSEHADRHLNLINIGSMLAITPQGELNALATLRYRPEFGRNNIYTIRVSEKKLSEDKHSPARRHKGKLLFGRTISYAQLSSILEDGGAVRSTLLTDNFSWDDYEAEHNSAAIPLFALGPKGKIHIFTSTYQPSTGDGWTVISLTPAQPL